ncbi:alcohol dehydrogenase catalytic domain-containing protein [Sulfurimonas lithotrophica]|uniref:Alcohol dehydrogenase catalytic domain-containing protein n=1 Tax=Sulfurimonas lithotrophica TaxID=2590022 RepID=A0A5P8P3C7_9BACT|nr:alcohol dehydrogenase catalytic domain-containing protein [Sulfurimonas lithotrophica]QFR50166.1 alcohol dehydrogenase catalytic domain-containing protein [Sulfurimonas lithotrophica]
MQTSQNPSRRDFIKTSAAIGAGLILWSPVLATDKGDKMNAITTKGYAAFDESGVLKPWTFTRRPVGDNDVLIDIKFASICHSDIHQEKGHWGKQQYPQVPGHEIAGVVTAVGKNVTKFKVGDRAGVGCMVDGCTTCENEEQYQSDTLFTYGYPDKREPTRISQGGYSKQIVVRDHYVVHIPDSLSFENAAPLLCAGITTYSPIMRADFKKGDKVAVAGIGGLGHMAVKFALSRGAEVYAFTTSADKVEDIKAFGVKEVIVVDDTKKLYEYAGQMDYMICTIPYQFDVAAYASVVKPYGFFTQVGMPEAFEITLNNLGLSFSRVNFNASLIGGMKETQEVVDYCAENKIYPQIEIIDAKDITDAWKKVENKQARFRYVIDTATI